MPFYRYRAYDAAGAPRSGVIEALSDAGVVRQLQSAGLIPVEAVEQGGAAREARWWERELFTERMLPPAGLALFTRELATLVEAGVPLDEALRIVTLHPMMAKVRRAAEQTLAHVLEGDSLAEAMERQGRFGDFFCSMVRAGETAGNLPEVLRQLATALERAVETRARIRSALVYPCVLVAMAVGGLILISAVLLPTIVPIFTDAGAEPPFIIRFILAIQSGLARHWMLLGVCLFGAAVAIIALWQTPQARIAAHRLVLKAPLIGPLVTMAETAKLARTLASLLGSGVPILMALRIVGGVAGNDRIAAAIADAAEEVKEGRMLSRGLGKSGVFPSLMLRLTAVGEETGRLEPMLRHVEKIFEGQVHRRLEHLLTLLTPSLHERHPQHQRAGVSMTVHACSVRPAERGFSLLELIVVLTILSLSAAALVPLASPSGRSIEIDAAAREVAIGLRAARSAAIYGNRETVFTIDAAGGRYWSDAAPAPKALPAHMSVALGGERTVGRIRFFPDGSASGGTIVLRGRERAATIRIEALTGRASIDVVR